MRCVYVIAASGYWVYECTSPCDRIRPLGRYPFAVSLSAISCAVFSLNGFAPSDLAAIFAILPPAPINGTAAARETAAPPQLPRDVDLPNRQLTVVRSEWKGHVTPPKGGRLRRVPLAERLAQALRDARASPRAPRAASGRRPIPEPEGCPDPRAARVARACRRASTSCSTPSALTSPCVGRRPARFRSWPATRTWRRRCGTCT